MSQLWETFMNSLVSCYGCKERVSVRHAYKDQHGWRHANCAPERGDGTHTFGKETLLAGDSLSGSTTNFFGHHLRVSTGAFDPEVHGGYERPYGEVEVDGREYWLVPKDSEII